MNATGTRVEQVSDSGVAPLIGALAVFLAGAAVVTWVDLDRLSAHMAAHIGSMNVAAPISALLLRGRLSMRWGDSPARLWLATAIQMALLWASHVPTVHHMVQSFPFALVAMHAALFLAALAFWICIVEAASNSRWQAMLALLVCGKLSCLLGALLIFAPRPLLASAGSGHALHHGSADHAAALADQHFAGLLMVAACPLSYVLAAVVLAAQTVSGLDRCALPSSARFGGR